MKNYCLVLLLLCCHCIAGAQAKKDSVIHHSSVSGELTEKSDSSEGKYFKYLPLRMAAGDVAYLIYESKDFVVSLAVRDSLGHSAAKIDNSIFIRAKGSKVLLPFRAASEGPYYFFFTTGEKAATGKFTVSLYYYTQAKDMITSNSSFCDKLHYIADNAYLGFEFLKKEKKESMMIESYEPSIALLPDATCVIQHNLDDSYVCTYPVSKDLKAATKKFQELEKQIAACGFGYAKKVYTAAMAAELERPDFVRRVDFTLPGTLPYDMQSAHAPEKIKGRISLRVTGAEKDGYRLRLTVD